MRKWIAGAAILTAGLALAACTTPEPTSTPTGTPTASAGACPEGTTADDGICLGSDPIAAELADVLRDTFDQGQVTAVIAGVWHDGEPVLTGSLGESLPGVPATTDMHHMLGNLATPMFTTVLLQQVDAGVLSLDDPLSKWFPDIPAADQVTLDMIVHNISGYEQFTEIPEFLQELYADPFAHVSLERTAEIGVGDGPIFTPGTDWQFSDTNTALLAMVVEKATGRTVSELLQEGVFDPLGMDDTTAALIPNWREPVLHGYSLERGVWEDVTFWNPSWAGFAGSPGSNQEDVRVFLQAFESGELLSEESHQRQLALETDGIGFNGPDAYWAMGALVTRGWTFMNPGIPGYYGAGGSLIDQGWTMVVYTTPSMDADPDRKSVV